MSQDHRSSRPVEVPEDEMELGGDSSRGLGGQPVPVLAGGNKSHMELFHHLPGEDQLGGLELVAPAKELL